MVKSKFNDKSCQTHGKNEKICQIMIIFHLFFFKQKIKIKAKNYYLECWNNVSL